MNINKKLVMTLLVRDEEEIIEQNICFHLNNGVDFIIVTNNNSVDKTSDILEKYRKMGYLTYLNQSSETFEQSKWVSNMANIAIDKYSADFLIHVDADEFWYPSHGTLKDCIDDETDLSIVNVVNYLPQYNTNDESYLNDNYVVSNGINCPKEYNKKDVNKYLLYRYHPKIITSSKYRNIGMGNHVVVDNNGVKPKWNNNIQIHHFPIRSFNNFKTKVINGGKSLSNNLERDLNMGWQWRKWYEIYESGEIERAYKELCMTDKLQEYLMKEIIKYSEVPKKIRWSKKLFIYRRLRDYFKF